MDGRHQVHYLPRFAVDKNVECVGESCLITREMIDNHATDHEMDQEKSQVHLALGKILLDLKEFITDPRKQIKLI